MKAVSFAVFLLLFLPSLSHAEMPPFLHEYEPNQEPNGSEAVKILMNSMLDLYAPSLKLKFIGYEKMIKEMTHFSGTISLRSSKKKGNPTMAGEAQFRNGDRGEEEKPLVNWSIKTSLDFSSSAIGMSLWRETPLGKVSFTHELEQDFSDELSYRGLFKLEKSF